MKQEDEKNPSKEPELVGGKTCKCGESITKIIE